MAKPVVNLIDLLTKLENENKNKETKHLSI